MIMKRIWLNNIYDLWHSNSNYETSSNKFPTCSTTQECRVWCSTNHPGLGDQNTTLAPDLVAIFIFPRLSGDIVVATSCLWNVLKSDAMCNQHQPKLEVIPPSFILFPSPNKDHRGLTWSPPECFQMTTLNCRKGRLQMINLIKGHAHVLAATCI